VPVVAAGVPEVVELFFSGSQVATKAERLTELYADEFCIAFVGPFTGATTGMVLDKAAASAAIGNLAGCFPDLTFNPTKVAPEKNAKGGYGAKILVTGKHTGGAFTPMPGKLPAVETTGKEVGIGPELFTMYVNAEGKATRLEIEPLHEGALVGPPGFYVSIGGVLPSPAAPAAAPAGVKLDAYGYILQQEFKDAASMEEACKIQAMYLDLNSSFGASTAVIMKTGETTCCALFVYPDSAAWLKVRKTPSLPRSWTNFSSL
jgi:hypothetical protein